jgi:hypothetical protein
VAAAKIKSFGVKGSNCSYILLLKSQEDSKEGRVSSEQPSSRTTVFLKAFIFKLEKERLQ